MIFLMQLHGMGLGSSIPTAISDRSARLLFTARVLRSSYVDVKWCPGVSRLGGVEKRGFLHRPLS